LYYGFDGEPDIYNDGEMCLEPIDVADWQIADMDEYQRRRAVIPTSDSEPQTVRELVRRRWRLDSERTMFKRMWEICLRERWVNVPRDQELNTEQWDILYEVLEAVNAFKYLPGLDDSEYEGDWPGPGPSQREMWTLLRDSGYVYIVDWDNDDLPNPGWHRCGFRTEGSIRGMPMVLLRHIEG